jgi:hypothetical protein
MRSGGGNDVAFMRMLNPDTHPVKHGSMWMLVGVAVGFAASFAIGTIIIKLCGLRLTKDE